MAFIKNGSIFIAYTTYNLSRNTMFRIVNCLLNFVYYVKVITTKEKPVLSNAVYLHPYSPVTGSLWRPLKQARTVVLWSRCLTNCLHARKEAKICLIDSFARQTLAINGPQSFRYMTCLCDLITPRSKKIRYINDVVKQLAK